MPFVKNDDEFAENWRGGAEQLLLDALLRAARNPAGRFALVLRLDGLVPTLRPHHRRVALVLLQEAAERHAGQVFPLRNGDLVLLCRAPADPGALAARLARLFAAEAPDPARIISLWPLADGAAPLLAYAAERLAAPDGRNGAAAPELFPCVGLQPAGFAPAFDVAAFARRQTAVLIEPAHEGGGSLRPLLREIGFPPSALAPRFALALAHGEADPDLVRHARRAPERRLIAAITEALAGTGPLGMRGSDTTLGVALTPGSVREPAFERLADRVAGIGVRLAVAIRLDEAMGEAEAFVRARQILRGHGVGFILDAISPLALTLTRPEALGADLLKLEWSSSIAEAYRAERQGPVAVLAARIAGVGPERIVLAGAGDERAVLWGLGHGIRRFQGSHVDAMLAAERMLTCPMAGGCTLRQCVERAAATAADGRRLCRNRALLDTAGPGEASIPAEAEAA